MRPDKPLQVTVGLALLVVGLVLIGFHFWQHRASSCTLDGDLKVGLGIGAVGLLLLPFDFSNIREVASKRFSGAFKSPPNGGASPPSAPSSP